MEWILHDRPQVALRVVERGSGVGLARVGIGVGDLSAERERLLEALDKVSEISVVPSVIAVLELHDDDGNALVLWQDLLPRRADVPRRDSDEG